MGHRDVVALLLGHMDLGQIAAKDDEGKTALHRAALCGHRDVVALLESKMGALEEWEREHGSRGGDDANEEDQH